MVKGMKMQIEKGKIDKNFNSDLFLLQLNHIVVEKNLASALEKSRSGQRVLFIFDFTRSEDELVKAMEWADLNELPIVFIVEENQLSHDFGLHRTSYLGLYAENQQEFYDFVYLSFRTIEDVLKPALIVISEAMTSLHLEPMDSGTLNKFLCSGNKQSQKQYLLSKSVLLNQDDSNSPFFEVSDFFCSTENRKIIQNSSQQKIQEQFKRAQKDWFELTGRIVENFDILYNKQAQVILVGGFQFEKQIEKYLQIFQKNLHLSLGMLKIKQFYPINKADFFEKLSDKVLLGVVEGGHPSEFFLDAFKQYLNQTQIRFSSLFSFFSLSAEEFCQIAFWSLQKKQGEYVLSSYVCDDKNVSAVDSQIFESCIKKNPYLKDKIQWLKSEGYLQFRTQFLSLFKSKENSLTKSQELKIVPEFVKLFDEKKGDYNQVRFFQDRFNLINKSPLWNPDLCTGCGKCWSYCPDGALPVHVHTFTEVIEGAAAVLRKKGVCIDLIFDYLTEIEEVFIEVWGQLKINFKNGFNQSVDLFFDRVSLSPGETSRLKNELESIKQLFEVKSFKVFQSQASGEFFFLQIGVNPYYCNSCGLCLQVCEEEALVWNQELAKIETVNEQLKWFYGFDQTSRQTIKEMSNQLMNKWGGDLFLNHLNYHRFLPGFQSGNILLTAFRMSLLNAFSFQNEIYNQVLEDIDQFRDGIKEKLQKLLEISFDDLDSLKDLSDLDGSRLQIEEIVGQKYYDKNQFDLIISNLKDLDKVDLFFNFSNQKLTRSNVPVFCVDQDRLVKQSLLSYYGPVYSCSSDLIIDQAIEFFNTQLSLFLDHIFIMRRAKAIKDDLDLSNVERPIHFRDLSDEEWKLFPPVLVVGSDRILFGRIWSQVLSVVQRQIPIKFLVFNFLDVIPFGLIEAIEFHSVHVLSEGVHRPEQLSQRSKDLLFSSLPSILQIYCSRSFEELLDQNRLNRWIEQSQLAWSVQAYPVFYYWFEKDKKFKDCLEVILPRPEDTEQALVSINKDEDFFLEEKTKEIKQFIDCLEKLKTIKFDDFNKDDVIEETKNQLLHDLTQNLIKISQSEKEVFS